MQLDIFYTKVLTHICLKLINLEDILIKISCMRNKEYTK